MKNGTSAFKLKLIAVIAMLIDHIAWLLTVPTGLAFFMHIIGRIAMPIFCFLLAEGFYHTKSRKKYTLRLFVFAITSQLPYNLAFKGDLFDFKLMVGGTFNVFFTLLIGFIILWSDNNPKFHFGFRFAIWLFGLVFALFCDWMIIGVMWIWLFGTIRLSPKYCVSKKDKQTQICFFTPIAVLWIGIMLKTYGISYLFQIGVFLAIPLIYWYNGDKSGDKVPKIFANKWLFYVFYPLHLIILSVISQLF